MTTPKPAPPPGKWQEQIVTKHNERSKASTIQTELESKLRELKDDEDERHNR